MNAPRHILTPGESAVDETAAPEAAAAAPAEAPARAKPGPKPGARAAARAAAAAPSDDLAAYESEDLPPAPAAADGDFTPEQQAKIARMIADAVQASRSSQDPQTAAKLAAQRLEPEQLPTVEQAKMTCEDAVSRGIRPRAILTNEGWYTHPEMARVRDDLSKLAIGSTK